VLAALREDRAPRIRFGVGLAAPRHLPNDSIPLFCVSEGSFRGHEPARNEYELVRDLASAGAEVDLEGGMPLVAGVAFACSRWSRGCSMPARPSTGVERRRRDARLRAALRHTDIAELWRVAARRPTCASTRGLGSSTL